MSLRLAQLFAIFFLGAGALTVSAQEKLPYRDSSLSVEQRVADLLSRMTLEEKIAQLGGTWQNRAQVHDETQLFVGNNREFLPDRAAVLLKDGLGEMSRPSE